MAPQQDDSFKEDMKAWARLVYFEENGEFQGRLEVVKELHTLMQSPPTETTTQDPNLWAEKWNQVMWGAHYELDMAEAKAVATAKSQAVVSGKGLQLGKGERRWSNVAIHTNYYEPFPFPLSLVVVESVYYSWDELCDKFKKPEHKGDYSISMVQGKPPAPVVADLVSQATTMPSAPSTAQAWQNRVKASSEDMAHRRRYQLPDHTAQATYNRDANVTDLLKEAATQTCQRRKYSQRRPWITEGTLQALAKARQEEAVQTEDAKKSRNIAKRLARKDKVQWVHNQLTEDTSHTKTRMWNTTRRQKRGFQGRDSW